MVTKLPESSSEIGAALTQFDAALRRFRAAFANDEQLTGAIFEGADEWTSLLACKLVPHLAGEGCLIVAVTGGTNTGKSTVFNLLLGRAVSPVVATAAATARPVIAANAMRAAQCLDGKLVPEFDAKAFDAAAVLEHAAPKNTLYVATDDSLPGRLVLLDTPDVDSIEQEHWRVADTIRAAGDVLVAVLTGEKYKDDRVIAYFRQALASGRVVVPVMNKANPEHAFDVARKQLAEFRELVGTDAPGFAVPHDFSLATKNEERIRPLDGDQSLIGYINALDVPEIKRRVYCGTVAHVADRAADFLERAGEIALGLRTTVCEYEARAGRASMQFDPAPGAAVGGLFHEFVQSKRALPFKVAGNVGRAFVNTIATVGRTITGAIRRRATLEAPEPANDAALRKTQGDAIDRIVRELTASYHESARNLREPAAHLIRRGMNALDVTQASRAVREATLRSDNVSGEFRQFAYRTLDAWWSDHRGKRIALQTMDGILAVTPAAIAGAMAAHTAGMGVDVALAVGGPMAEQFAARVIEYQFGDALFDFLSPWRKEQRATLERAIVANVTRPVLAQLDAYLAVFDGDIMAELGRLQAQCSTV